MGPPRDRERARGDGHLDSRHGVLGSGHGWSVLVEWYVLTVAAASLIGAGAVWFLTRDPDEDWLRQTAVPEVDAALSVGDWQSAFMTAVEIERRLPGAPELAELWPQMAWTTSIRSDPPGATALPTPVGRRKLSGSRRPARSWSR